jgi:transformation/transcription domain-associated protein
MDAEPGQGDEELELDLNEGGEPRPTRESRQITDRRTALQLLVTRQSKFLQSASELRTFQFLQATAQICHMDTALAERTWLDLFPRLWHILSERHQTGLIGEMVPFLCSGAHVVQKDCQPSALNTFVEALAHCDPPVPIKP